MPNRQLERDDVYNFLLPYRARVYDPFELLAEIRQEIESWVEDGDVYKYKMTFKLKEVVDDEKKVYGVSKEMMNMVGAWQSPMSGKNWWVNPENPEARRYSDVNVECPNCGAVFGGTQEENSHSEHCFPSTNEEVKKKLHERRIGWLRDAALYGLNIETASKRLGLKQQTVQDMIWEEEDFSYKERKKEGKEVLATTWDIAQEWGASRETLAEASGISVSTFKSYRSRYSRIEGDIPDDPTSAREK